YMIGTVQDITKRKKIELALANSKNSLESKVEMRTMELLNEKKRIETIIETLPAGILVIDNDGHFYMSNKVFKTYYSQVYDTELPQSVKEILILGNPFGDTISNLVYSDKDKTITIEPLEGHHLEMTSSSLIDSTNNPIGVIISVRDISPFVEVNRLRQQFVSMVSHELRTPITAIDLSLKNLQTYKDRLSEEQKDELIAMVADSSSILNQMVEDLLIVSQIEAGELKLQFKPILVGKLFNDLLYQIEPKCKVKEIKVSMDIKPKIELFGDYKRLSQVFRILLDNAIKYSPEKSTVSITVTENYKGIEPPEEVLGTLVEISDQGIGIEVRDQSKLFRRFFRGSNTRGTPGTGLGLSIAKEFITLHGGKIYLESQIGEGSSFYIFFPKILHKIKEKQSFSIKNVLLSSLQG
ncbi:MAG: hypothetical protein KAT16_10515, partial [Candidatus Heimdallarchaeota archaeon]|nr:hypothetical protein [Candidatus Heimdallarchaeota archaeon]